MSNLTPNFYPAIEPFKSFQFPVSDLHTLYVEQVGNPDGEPVVFLHGGPGGGISPKHRQLFDPEFYHIILFDQRGAGQSTPHATLEENTTWDLVADMEKIREHLNIEKWSVFGGSWGSTLSLAYAKTHPACVSGLILRGIFLCRPEEIQWFYQEGCSNIFAEEWQRYLAPIPTYERHDLLNAYYRQLTSDDPQIRLTASKAWSRWEGACMKLLPDAEAIASIEADSAALTMARIECHYFVNNIFLPKGQSLLDDLSMLQHIPTWIIHGRYDLVCPAKNAVDLHQKMPHAQLQIIADAGHSFDEVGIANALIDAANAFKQAL